MNRQKKVRQCDYCSSICPKTDDHIPPKSLFPKPRSCNLITVPCCESCRRGWSKDDEYFRATIVSSSRVSEEPLAQGIIETLFRSLNRPEQKRFSQYLSASIGEVETFTEAGIYLGKTPVLGIDIKRIERVAQRIVKGLFFYEKGYSLPEGYEVVTRLQQFGLESVYEYIPDVKFPKLRIVQDGVFCYTYKETEEDINSSIWLFLFYKNLPFVGFTRLPPEMRREI